MEVNKAQWPEGTTVDLEGYYSPEGEMLNSEPHTQEFVDAWNGVMKMLLKKQYLILLLKNPVKLKWKWKPVSMD